MRLNTEAGMRRSAHAVQLYDRPEDLVGNVVAFVAEGIGAGEAAVLIAMPEHRSAVVDGLDDAGIDVAWEIDTGGLVLLDAAATLERFMVGDRPDPDRFDAVVGDLVRSMLARGRPLRAYGEMVAILWARGLVAAAIELEDLWNQLLAREQLSLLCAYPSELVAEGAAHVCDHHDSLVTAATFDRDVHAPRAARQFVAWALGSAGRGDAVPSTTLIVSELATNAVRHAGSAFSVTLKIGDGNGVRVAVRDGSPAAPSPRVASAMAEGGRGLQLVRELAESWGTDIDAAGKVVWAEIVE